VNSSSVIFYPSVNLLVIKKILLPTDFIPSVILFVIDMMNSVHSLPTDFIDGIKSVGNSIGKNDTSLFLFFLIFFYIVILSVFLFIFINFLVV
jgi:hypothetical protein